MKKTLRVIAFLLITIISICYVYNIISWKDTTGEYLSSTQQLYATEDNTIDLVFMGSSHCYCSINPSVLWDNYGISAFDMAISGQDKSSTYYTLKELLKTQSPQVVCIDMWGLVFEGYEVESNIYRNMLAMKTSSNSVELVRDCIDEEEQMDYILRWPIVHTRYREIGKYDFMQNEVSIYGRGFLDGYKKSKVDPIGVSKTEGEPLTEENKKWIDDLFQLSQEEGFTLIMFLAPTALPEEHQKIIKGAENYLREKGVEYINFNYLIDEVDLSYSYDFRDETHLNTLGANKVTAYFGEYLNEKYEFIDHRGDSTYHLWDECSLYMNHTAYQYELGKIEDADEYIQKLTESEDITVVISLDGQYQDSTLDLHKYVSYFGISDAEYYLGGKWIYENGKIIYYMNSGENEEYIYELSETDTLRIWNTQDALNNVGINGEPVNCCHNGLSIVVYDKVTKSIIDKKGYF